jgi:hypothetical protein
LAITFSTRRTCTSHLCTLILAADSHLQFDVSQSRLRISCHHGSLRPPDSSKSSRWWTVRLADPRKSEIINSDAPEPKNAFEMNAFVDLGRPALRPVFSSNAHSISTIFSILQGSQGLVQGPLGLVGFAYHRRSRSPTRFILERAEDALEFQVQPVLISLNNQ